MGQMVDATRESFDKVYTIELNRHLYEGARVRFSKFDNVSVFHGDSGEVLPRVLSDIDQPCLFWLDAHYSGGSTAKADLETPALLELVEILDHPVRQHVILIDDARKFSGTDSWPTIEALRSLVAGKRPDWVFEVRDDIVRIHRPR